MAEMMLSWPLALPWRERITQRFGERPEFYARWGLPGHNGMDFGAPVWTPVLAVDDGRVLWLRSDDAGFGLHLKVKHAWGGSLYAHLIAVDAAAGQEVRRGEVIAYSGNSGVSSGPHLHFGMQAGPLGNGYNGYVNPLPFVRCDLFQRERWQ